MPWFNFPNILPTFRNQANQKEVPQLDADGRIRVNTGSSIAPIVSPTPPASPSDGDLWYNTAAGQQELYAYDDTRSFWLSVNSTPYRFGHDNTDNAPLRSADIHTAGTGSGHRIPLDGMITRISARSRAGLATKGFDIRSDGSNGATTISSFNLAANVFVDNAASIQLASGDDLWVQSQAPGGPALDINVCLWVKWRVAP